MNLFLVPKVEEVLNWHQLQVLGVVGLVKVHYIVHFLVSLW
jgi:hypothetical protein